MNDKDLRLLLLQIIRVNGNTMHLFRLDVSMVRISQMIDALKKEKYVNSGDDGRLSLTGKGQRLFYRLNHQSRKKGMYRFLSPDWFYKDSPMPLDAVYVPIKKRVKSGKKQSL